MKQQPVHITVTSTICNSTSILLCWPWVLLQASTRSATNKSVCVSHPQREWLFRKRNPSQFDTSLLASTLGLAVGIDIPVLMECVKTCLQSLIYQCFVAISSLALKTKDGLLLSMGLRQFRYASYAQRLVPTLCDMTKE